MGVIHLSAWASALTAMPEAYTAIRIVGACYLIYLGIEAVLAARRCGDVPVSAARGQSAGSLERYCPMRGG
jgi:threonine/homoserine/homoserine lactone efflux protein